MAGRVLSGREMDSVLIEAPKPMAPLVSGPDLLRRFRTFIESSDWDVLTTARQRRLDRGCIAVFISAVLYFFPILGQICLR
ncbi:MAG: hypothetical protein LLG97_14740 [Deltaproteobacteria bacterium]|nr:hypothetical protein [Deltaproteobacteria bacterium]